MHDSRLLYCCNYRAIHGGSVLDSLEPLFVEPESFSPIRKLSKDKRKGYSYIFKKVSGLTFGYMALNPYILYLFKSFIVEECLETLFLIFYIKKNKTFNK